MVGTPCKAVSRPVARAEYLAAEVFVANGLLPLPGEILVRRYMRAQSNASHRVTLADPDPDPERVAHGAASQTSRSGFSPKLKLSDQRRGERRAAEVELAQRKVHHRQHERVAGDVAARRKRDGLRPGIAKL